MSGRVAAATLIFALWLPVPLTAAAPFLPDDDGWVLETSLPSADLRVRQMRRIAVELAAQPENLDLAMGLAVRQLAMGVAEADPRFVGYAQGTLARWWRSDPAAPPLRILRARILQAQHDFDAAAAELDAVLRDAPESPQALILLASIEEAIGHFDRAKETCARFARVRPGLTAIACNASIGSQTGDSEASYAALWNAVEHAASRDRGELMWALTVLGEIAVRRDDAAASEYFKQALALDPRNVYTQTVYADYLLEHGGAAEVIRLLTGLERIDALYLRLALAAQATGDQRFVRFRDDLSARFAAARRQGDMVHLRDASRFALQIEHNPPHALDLARQAWIRQKTPYDARVLLEAAIAGNDTAAADSIAAWVTATHLEDRTITRLLDRIPSH